MARPFGRSRLARRLGLELPLVQAPMAGGVTTPALVAAVSRAGALGSFAASYLEPEAVERALAEIAAAVQGRPFAVNLLVAPADAGGGDPGDARQALEPLARELGVQPGEPPAPAGDGFAAAFEAVLEAAPTAFSFAFGTLEPALLERLHERGIAVLATATTVAEAVALAELGVDAVVAQGAEAGGHRGTFIGSFEDGLVGTMALVPQVVDAVDLPVVAAGGIMDGRGIAAALVLGADAVQLGTAFIVAAESGASPAHRRAVLGARERPTTVSHALTGRPARVLENRLVREVRGGGLPVAPYPAQSALLRPLREESLRRDDPEYLPLFAGQAAPLARTLPAAELVRALAEETERALGASGA